MHLISWNVNGIRAIVKKEFLNQINLLDPDILCLQETKAQDDQVSEALKGLPNYYIYSHSATKKGYSGVAIITKQKPIEVSQGIGIEIHDDEGRVIEAEYNDFIIVNVYVPNSGDG